MALADVRIRPLVAADYDAVFSLWRRCEGIHLHNDTSESLAGFRRVLDRNPGLSHAAEHRGSIVGAVMCTHDGRRGSLSHVAVDSAYRGQGIGKALVQRCLALLSREGIDKSAVSVLKENERARAFWEHMGFVKVDVIETYVREH